MQLTTLTKRLIHFNLETDIKNNSISDISFIKYLMPSSYTFHHNTLYIADTSTTSYEQISTLPINLLLVSAESSPVPLIANMNQNIIYIQDENVMSIFNVVLEIISEDQKLAKDSAILLDALSSGKGLQYIVDIASELIGNPIFIRDTQYNILAFTKNVSTEDPIWNDVTEKGYQNHHYFQYRMKHGYVERANKFYIPIYYKLIDDLNTDMIEQLEIEISPDLKYLLYPIAKQNNIIKHSRLACSIRSQQKFLGELVVLDVYKSFSDYDIALINQVNNVLSLELQKNKSSLTSNSLKTDLFIADLLEGKIKDIEILEDKIKIMNLNFKNYLRLVVLVVNQKDESGIPLNYIRGLFTSLFGDVISTFYKGSFIAIYDTSKDKMLSETQIKQLINFSEESGMLCGISRSFTCILDIQKHYNQSIEAIKSGKRLNKKQVLFYYEDFVLQHLFNICSTQDSLQNFCHPAVLALMDYDAKSKTDHCKTLYSYVMKFKNPSDLANEMKVHRNTLYYRISKIEEIMNITLNNVDTLFSIYLSFKILEYLNIKPEW